MHRYENRDIWLLGDLREIKAVIDAPDKWGKSKRAPSDAAPFAIEIREMFDQGINWRAPYEPINGVSAGAAIYKVLSSISRIHLTVIALIAELPQLPWPIGPWHNLADFTCYRAETTHDDVMALFDRAISKAEKLARSYWSQFPAAWPTVENFGLV